MVIVTIDKGRENKMSSPETDTKVVVVVHGGINEEFYNEIGGKRSGESRGWRRTGNGRRTTVQDVGEFQNRIVHSIPYTTTAELPSTNYSAKGSNHHVHTNHSTGIAVIVGSLYSSSGSRFLVALEQRGDGGATVVPTQGSR